MKNILELKMIELTESEQSDLLSYYSGIEIDEQETVQPVWVSRKFPSTGRVIRCVELNGRVIIKQLVDRI